MTRWPQLADMVFYKHTLLQTTWKINYILIFLSEILTQNVATIIFNIFCSTLVCEYRNYIAFLTDQGKLCINFFQSSKDENSLDTDT